MPSSQKDDRTRQIFSSSSFPSQYSLYHLSRPPCEAVVLKDVKTDEDEEDCLRPFHYTRTTSPEKVQEIRQDEEEEESISLARIALAHHQGSIVDRSIPRGLFESHRRDEDSLLSHSWEKEREEQAEEREDEEEEGKRERYQDNDGQEAHQDPSSFLTPQVFLETTKKKFLHEKESYLSFMKKPQSEDREEKDAFRKDLDRSRRGDEMHAWYETTKKVLGEEEEEKGLRHRRIREKEIPSKEGERRCLLTSPLTMTGARTKEFKHIRDEEEGEDMNLISMLMYRSYVSQRSPGRREGEQEEQEEDTRQVKKGEREEIPLRRDKRELPFTGGECSSLKLLSSYHHRGSERRLSGLHPTMNRQTAQQRFLSSPGRGRTRGGGEQEEEEGRGLLLLMSQERQRPQWMKSLLLATEPEGCYEIRKEEKSRQKGAPFEGPSLSQKREQSIDIFLSSSVEETSQKELSVISAGRFYAQNKQGKRKDSGEEEDRNHGGFRGSEGRTMRKESLTTRGRGVHTPQQDHPRYSSPSDDKERPERREVATSISRPSSSSYHHHEARVSSSNLCSSSSLPPLSSSSLSSCSSSPKIPFSSRPPLIRRPSSFSNLLPLYSSYHIAVSSSSPSLRSRYFSPPRSHPFPCRSSSSSSLSSFTTPSHLLHVSPLVATSPQYSTFVSPLSRSPSPTTASPSYLHRQNTLPPLPAVSPLYEEEKNSLLLTPSSPSRRSSSSSLQSSSSSCAPRSSYSSSPSLSGLSRAPSFSSSSRKQPRTSTTPIHSSSSSSVSLHPHVLFRTSSTRSPCSSSPPPSVIVKTSHPPHAQESREKLYHRAIQSEAENLSCILKGLSTPKTSSKSKEVTKGRPFSHPHHECRRRRKSSDNCLELTAEGPPLQTRSSPAAVTQRRVRKEERQPERKTDRREVVKREEEEEKEEEKKESGVSTRKGEARLLLLLHPREDEEEEEERRKEREEGEERSDRQQRDQDDNPSTREDRVVDEEREDDPHNIDDRWRQREGEERKKEEERRRRLPNLKARETPNAVELQEEKKIKPREGEEQNDKERMKGDLNDRERMKGDLNDRERMKGDLRRSREGASQEEKNQRRLQELLADPSEEDEERRDLFPEKDVQDNPDDDKDEEDVEERKLEKSRGREVVQEQEEKKKETKKSTVSMCESRVIVEEDKKHQGKSRQHCSQTQDKREEEQGGGEEEEQGGVEEEEQGGGEEEEQGEGGDERFDQRTAEKKEEEGENLRGGSSRDPSRRSERGEENLPVLSQILGRGFQGKRRWRGLLLRRGKGRTREDSDSSGSLFDRRFSSSSSLTSHNSSSDEGDSRRRDKESEPPAAYPSNSSSSSPLSTATSTPPSLQYAPHLAHLSPSLFFPSAFSPYFEKEEEERRRNNSSATPSYTHQHSEKGGDQKDRLSEEEEEEKEKGQRKNKNRETGKSTRVTEKTFQASPLRGPREKDVSSSEKSHFPLGVASHSHQECVATPFFSRPCSPSLPSSTDQLVNGGLYVHLPPSVMRTLEIRRQLSEAALRGSILLRHALKKKKKRKEESKMDYNASEGGEGEEDTSECEVSDEREDEEEKKEGQGREGTFLSPSPFQQSVYDKSSRRDSLYVGERQKRGEDEEEEEQEKKKSGEECFGKTSEDVHQQEESLSSIPLEAELAWASAVTTQKALDDVLAVVSMLVKGKKKLTRHLMTKEEEHFR
ncbi:hypothetical protein CSUI_003269 [Cystoisospora suis]|uniref:Uncharacterized protein n=1 Tax=Cystoisospora suis TaxID=483139 RepID=A0A2C6KR09_9APIC|nr:hypothetical protein CSUI_003269 [Cystoisospora suis]